MGVAHTQFEPALGYLQRAGVRALLVHGHVNLLAERLQLGNGGRTVGVGRHQQRSPAVFAKRQRQLGRAGGLSRSLQPDHQHH